jgi:hypothetical protein
MDLREIRWGDGVNSSGTVCEPSGMRWWTFGFWRHGVSYLVVRLIPACRKRMIAIKVGRQIFPISIHLDPCEYEMYTVAASLWNHSVLV